MQSTVLNMVKALRALYKGDLAEMDHDRGPGPRRKASSIEVDLVERLQRAAEKSEEEKLFAASPEIAFERLMKTRDVLGPYGQATTSGTQTGDRVPERGEVVLASSGTIALPPRGMRPVDLQKVSPRAAVFLESVDEKMLRPASEIDWGLVASTKAYMDPTLRVKKNMVKLAGDVWERGMLRFAPTVKCHASMFTMMKKVLDDGAHSLRLIMDLR